MTLPLFDTRPPVPPGDVDAVIAYLSGRGWCKAKSMADRWSDRTLRELANASQGRVISGQRGYALVNEASVEDARHAAAWLRHQGQQMIRRAHEIEQAMHVSYRRAG